MPESHRVCPGILTLLKSQIAMVKQWVEHSSRLGGKTIRIFAGNVDKGDTEEKARARCIEAIQGACDHAGKYGIILALENHGGITRTIDQTLHLVQAVRHDWFGVNWDTGNFHSADPYADLTKLAPYAVTVQIKTEIQREGQKKEEADLARLIGILRAAGYRGYVLASEKIDTARSGPPQLHHIHKPCTIFAFARHPAGLVLQFFHSARSPSFSPEVDPCPRTRRSTRPRRKRRRSAT
jgi:sugar phosphate isomerase/epimerase